MRHNVFGRKLNRDIKERKSLFRGLIASLITHGQVKTTVPRAKAIRGLAEKVVTWGKENTNSSKNKIYSLLNRREVVEQLTNKIVPRFQSKIGGYLKMIRIGNRPGDNTEEVILKWSIDEPKKEEKKPAVKGAKEEKEKKVTNKEKTAVKEGKK